MKLRYLWIIWFLLTAAAAFNFFYVITTDRAEGRQILLPGETTHGHYQIELACDACHTEFMGVKQDACESCHLEDLKRDKDTHPASKFNDPTNADRLAKLDAQKCITCHREHVPDRTGDMGLSIPSDYCWHCHEDVAEQRPSHVGMKHDSCQTAGCHNYHDNLALYENFLYTHRDEEDFLDDGRVVHRNFLASWSKGNPTDSLSVTDADAPSDLLLRPIVNEWSSTAHANAGVNCRACHDVTSEDSRTTTWKNKVGFDTCESCHPFETKTFLKGRHGMRLAMDMTPMSPSRARLEFKQEAGHKKLNCSSCHQPHRYDTNFAAVDACIGCHDDEHTKNYLNSSHYELWKNETNNESGKGSGVSCATCHMPRVTDDGGVVHVQHNQNDNLRPNEKMIRSVCISCHGLQFSLNALADTELIEKCFQGSPSVNIDSVKMAKEWFEEKERQKQERQNKRAKVSEE